MVKKINTTSTQEERSSLGLRIKKIVEFLHIEQQELAESAKISKQTVSAYISGKSQPSADVLACWVRVFNINANWLLTGQGNMFPEGQAENHGIPSEETSPNLTPEQRNMLTYKRLQTELGTEKSKIAAGIDAIVTGKCVSEPPKPKYGGAEEKGLDGGTIKVQEDGAEFGR